MAEQEDPDTNPGQAAEEPADTDSSEAQLPVAAPGLKAPGFVPLGILLLAFVVYEITIHTAPAHAKQVFYDWR